MAWLARMKEEGIGDSGDGVQLKMDMQLTLVKPDGMERYQTLRLPSAKGIMRIFAPVSVPAWRTEQAQDFIKTALGTAVQTDMEEAINAIEKRLGIYLTE